MEERIFKLESEIKELKNKIKMLEERLYKKYKKKSIDFGEKDILEIIYKSVKDGTLLEDYIYYYVDKDIMHKIAEGYGVNKRVLNYNIVNNIDCVIGVNKNNAYFQKRVNGKNTWLYRINKNVLNKERDEYLEE